MQETALKAMIAEAYEGASPDTIPILTSTAVQVDEPMKSHVTSMEVV